MRTNILKDSRAAGAREAAASGRRVGRLALGLLLALGLGATQSRAAAATEKAEKTAKSLPTDAVATIGVDEVHRGQRGYGLSVFAGIEPDRFDVEVIGVMRNIRPGVSYILAKLTGQGLERDGVVEGMSGSPVFLDGKLAGAVAFGWSFANDAVAGITPIGMMRELSGLKGLPPVPSAPPINLSQLQRGDFSVELIERQFDRLRPRLADGARSAVQWSASGFGEGSLGWLRRAVGDVATSGQAAPGAAGVEVALGGSISAILMDGDLRMAATGTVTDRYGDQVLAFGHPFLGLGPVRIPMATSEVLTVLSNQNNSFKIANSGTIVGAFEQDRQSGIQGRLGIEAPMFPMRVRVAGGSGETPREFNMRLAELPEFIPLLIGTALLGTVETTSYTAGNQGLDVEGRLILAKYGEIRFRQSLDGDNAGLKAAAFVLSLAALLTNSPFEQVDFAGIDVEIQQTRLPRLLDLASAIPDRTLVRPGEKVKVRVDLVPFRGERQRKEVTVTLPGDLGPGRYTLLVGDGASIDGARLTLEPAEPETLPQVIARLRNLHSRRDLVVLGMRPAAGLSVAGEPMPDLPGSVRSLWGAASSVSGVALTSKVVQEVSVPLDGPAQGLLRIDLDVRREAGEETEESAPDAPAGTEVAGRRGVAGPAPQPSASAEGAVGVSTFGNGDGKVER